MVSNNADHIVFIRILTGQWREGEKQELLAFHSQQLSGDQKHSSLRFQRNAQKMDPTRTYTYKKHLVTLHLNNKVQKRSLVPF